MPESIGSGAESAGYDGGRDDRISRRRSAGCDHDGEPHRYFIRDINLRGVKYLNEDLLKSSAGLVAGDSIYLPSNIIGNVIARLWNQRLFADVKIGAEIDGDSIDLEVFLKERPRVYRWNFEGISKGKKKDLTEKLKLKPNSELSDYVIDKNQKLIKKYWAEKAFRNAEVDVRIDNDTLRPAEQAVTVTFLIDRKERVKIGQINFHGNEQFKDKRLRRTFKKTHQKTHQLLQERQTRGRLRNGQGDCSSTSTTRKATATSRS